MSNVTAKVKLEIETSLRRGFSNQHLNEPDKINKIDAIEMRVDRINVMQDDIQVLYNLLGKPNKSNVRKWRGKEHRSPYDTSLLTKYFSLTVDLESIKKEVSKLRGVSSSDKMPMSVAFSIAAKSFLSDDIYRRIEAQAKRIANQPKG